VPLKIIVYLKVDLTSVTNHKWTCQRPLYNAIRRLYSATTTSLLTSMDWHQWREHNIT